MDKKFLQGLILIVVGVAFLSSNAIAGCGNECATSVITCEDRCENKADCKRECTEIFRECLTKCLITPR